MRWTPVDTEEERALAGRLRRSSRFYRFLWEIRSELFSPEFEAELAGSYKPRGQEPCAPAQLAMALLLQRYDGVSDAGAVDAAEHDTRWQLVLGTLGTDQSPFGQGSLVRFRSRMIANDLDKKLVDRTIEIAKDRGSFGAARLRVALDSSPLHGAGRVEDTWNLIGRAMSKVVCAVARALGVDEDRVIDEAGVTVLGASSVKAALDLDWDDETATLEGLQQLLSDVSRLEAWVVERASEAVEQPPVQDALELLRKVVDQDTEPDPPSKGRRIKQGVPRDRIVSIADPEMRHGRKSKTKLFNGYKRHVAVVDRFVVGTAVVPANVKEHEPTDDLLAAASKHGDIEILDIDRGYLASKAVEQLHRSGATVHSRPWKTNNQGRFTKDDFVIDLKRRRVRCPEKKTAPITRGNQAFFREADCSACALKDRCTTSSRRAVSIHPAEGLLIELREQKKTAKGRKALRSRVAVEHRLARIGAIQGTKARYFGARKNELDLNRAAAIANLQEINRRAAA